MDELVLQWLMGAIAYAIRLHDKISMAKKPFDNRGPRYYDKKTYEAYEEPFARWMGWRGQEAQEEEIRRMREEKR